MSKKIELGKTYVDSNSRFITPYEYLPDHKAWMCHIEVVDIDENGDDAFREYDDYLMSSDILS